MCSSSIQLSFLESLGSKLGLELVCSICWCPNPAPFVKRPPPGPQEASHEHLMRRRALRDAQTPEKLKRNRSLAANSQLSVEEKKRKIIRNLRRLESLGLVDSAHQYQGLVNELAKVGWGWGGRSGALGGNGSSP